MKREDALPVAGVALASFAIATAVLYVLTTIPSDAWRIPLEGGLGVAGVCVVMYFFLRKRSEEAAIILNHQELTTRVVSVILLGSYLLLMVLTFSHASGNQNDPWLEIFRNGFVLLGGTVSTVVGYYFGAKGTEKAQSEATKSALEAEQANSIAKNIGEASEIDDENAL